MELPRAIESEQAVLGAMISYPKVTNEVIEELKPEDFYYINHKKIFEEMKELYNIGVVLDIPTLAQSLNNKGVLKDVGGVTYLDNLYAGATLGDNINYHCEIIKDRAMKRSIIEISRELVRKAYDTRIKAKDIINNGAEELYKLSQEKGKIYTISECMSSTLEEIEKRYNKKGALIGETTGIENLDKATGGLQKGNLVVIAGRPSMGKTALALNIASSASKESKVAIFSFEMPKEELADRLLSDEGNVVLGKIKSGKLSDQDFIKISEASCTLSNRYAHVYDGGALTVAEIKAKSMKIKMKTGLDVIVIDYLQLINGCGNSNGNRVYEISKISGELKNLARELNIAVVVLSQLSRATEGRVDKRPMMSDLRESGAIEQDADIIALLYRDEYYNKDSEDKGICEVLIAKNRNGKTGVIKLNWMPEYQRFFDRKSSCKLFS